MAKRPVRRPTEEQALSNIGREQKRLARTAARQVAQDVRAGRQVSDELLALARKVLLEE